MTTSALPLRSRRAVIAFVAAVLAATGLAAADLPALAADPGRDVTVYDDAPGDGFVDYSWGSVDLASPQPVASGSAAMEAQLGPWEGLYLAAPGRVAIPTSGELRFAMHGGTNPDAVVQVQLIGPGGVAGAPFEVRPDAGRWQQVTIPLADLGGYSAIEGLWWQEARGGTLAPIHVDDVVIVAGDAPPPTDGPALTVDVGARTIVRSVTDPYTDATTDVVVAFPHPISEDVYGLNFAPNTLREELGVPVNRWGGNAVERYNHRTGSSNSGRDWYFATTDGEVGGDHAFEAANQADGAASILTIPLMGWVSAGAAATCSFPTNDSLGPEHNAGPQDAEIDHWLDPSVSCGNGFRDGQFLGPAEPTVTSVAVDESWAADWVGELVATHGSAAAGGVEIYALGNEPGLWHSTHGDLRGEPIGRQEIFDRNLAWAAAIKGADPTAAVIGPVLWSGYSYYVTTPEVVAGQYPGVLPTFVGEYLATMAAGEARTGTRLLDLLAVNFYDDRVYNGGTDSLRLEATRSLWDPTYAPPDWWVTRDFLEGDGSAVIPRLQSLIDANYPGTGLAITEYNFGGPDTIAGALAQADVLGILGREGVDLATVWEPYATWTGMPEEEFADRPLFWAFRLYRNYDGAGGRFGDRSLFASSTDEGAVSVFAATRTADGALTIMVVNKTTGTQSTPLDLAGTAGGQADVYRYGTAGAQAIETVGSLPVGDGTVLTLPPRSATLLVIPADSTPPPPEETTTTAGPPTTSSTTAPPTTGPPTPPPVGGIVDATVSYGDGTPVAGVAVDVFADAGGGARGQWLGDGRTDATGSATLDLSGSACHVLTFVAPAGERFRNGTGWQNVPVCPGPGERVAASATLAGSPDAEAAIGGTVDRGGAPVADVVVDLFLAQADGSRGPWLGATSTDDAGRYSFDVAAGCAVVTMIAPAGETFTSGSPWHQARRMRRGGPVPHRPRRLADAVDPSDDEPQNGQSREVG